MKTIIILLFLLSSSVALSYSEDNSLHIGKEFVVCFPQNYKIYNRNGDTALAVFVASFKNKKSNFTVEYNIDNTPVTINGVVEANEIVRVTLPLALEINVYDKNERKAVFIRSDDSVSVMAISKERGTSDGGLCFPNEVLGQSYITASYKNCFHKGRIGKSAFGYSNIVIAATEDNTRVEIIPTAPIEGFINDNCQPISFRMNKGETRQIIAKKDKEYDLTGSFVNSDKKIAVYSCHQATLIRSDGYPDVLIEQTLPIPRLGSETIFNPIKTNFHGTKSLGRIIAPFDNTEIRLVDTSMILNRSEFYEFIFDSANYVTASKPVLFAEYCLSGLLNKIKYCDPFLVLLPPVQSYMNDYSFASPVFASLLQHRISVVIPKNALSSLTLDDQPVSVSDYTEVKGADYVFFAMDVTAGNHRMTADSAFGLMVYGFGEAESYGYIPGMRTHRQIDRIMDKEAPAITMTGECAPQMLLIKETGEYITGLGNIDILAKENVEITFDYQKHSEALAELSLKDMFQDGYAELEVVDINGNRRRESFHIKGFTIKPDYNASDSVYVNEVFCNSFTIENYGAFDQEYECVLAENYNISVPPSYLNVTSESAASSVLPYCISAHTAGEVQDTIYLIDACGRTVAVAIKALIKPKVYSGQSKCNVPLNLTVGNQPGVGQVGNLLSFNNFTGEIKVYTTLGEQVFSAKYHKECGSERIDLSSGVYFTVITEGGENVTVRKIVTAK